MPKTTVNGESKSMYLCLDDGLKIHDIGAAIEKAGYDVQIFQSVDKNAPNVVVVKKA